MDLSFMILKKFHVISGTVDLGEPLDFYFKLGQWTWEALVVVPFADQPDSLRYATTYTISRIDWETRQIMLDTPASEMFASLEDLQRVTKGRLLDFSERVGKPVLIRDQQIGVLRDLILAPNSFVIEAVAVDTDGADLEGPAPTLYPADRIVTLKADGSIVLREDDPYLYDVPANVYPASRRQVEYLASWQSVQ